MSFDQNLAYISIMIKILIEKEILVDCGYKELMSKNSPFFDQRWCYFQGLENSEFFEDNFKGLDMKKLSV